MQKNIFVDRMEKVDNAQHQIIELALLELSLVESSDDNERCREKDLY